MQTINQHIQQGKFSRVYLLYGSEAYLKRTFRGKLKDAVLPSDDDMNYSYFEGKQVNVSEVASLIDTLPFLAEHRLVVLENTGWFKSANDFMAEAVKQIPETTVVIFSEEEVDKRGKLYKAVKQEGYVAELSVSDTRTLCAWIGKNLQKDGLTMSRPVMEHFLDRVGTDMENILSELEKLVCFCYGRKVIEAEDVDQISSVQLSNRIFDMITAVAEQRTKKALELYSDLLVLKEPPIKILVLMTRQFNYLMQVKELSGGGMYEKEIASHLKIQPFIVKKYMQQMRHFSFRKLKIAFAKCVETDEAIKTGRISDKLGVEMLIIQFSSK